MKIKRYDGTNKVWKTISSSNASSIKVEDVDGNFKDPSIYGTDSNGNKILIAAKSKNAETCFKQLSTDLSTLTNRVEYIYENGTIGGGGGGGGTTMPTITLQSDKEVNVRTDQVIDIYYFFQSPNIGVGTVTLSIDYISETKAINQGRNKWTVGPFEKGTHKLTIFAVDQAGLFSNSVDVIVSSGALEITSKFDDTIDFTLKDDIKIKYTISSLSAEEVQVDLTLDGTTKTVTGNIGDDNIWNIGELSSLGIHTASIIARQGTLVSNELFYNLVLSDSESLYLSSTYKETEVFVGKNISIPFRNSMLGESKFYTDFYINSALTDTVISYSGVNFWNVGNNLPIGSYQFSMQSRTLDDAFKSNIVTLKVDVVSEDYIPYKIIEDGLVFNFDAAGKSNTSLTKNKWIDTSENEIECTLYNFNYSTNGWIDNTLVFNGKTYAEIDYTPFKEKITEGMTIDILFNVENVGDIDGKVLWCKNAVTPYQGLYIDTQEGSLWSYSSKVIEASHREKVWTRMTFVIKKDETDNPYMLLYINGYISKLQYINVNEAFDWDGKIILGAGLDEDGNVVNNSSCAIRTFRIYNRALSDDEVLHNHIADVNDRDEQLALRELNYDFGEKTIPEMVITGNIDFGENEDIERTVSISYDDKIDPTKKFVKDECLISIQGTSSKQYPVKNYTIKLRNGGMDWLTYAPKDDWIPESRYTLKANYMDSSHANNVGTAKFVNDFFKENPYPSQIKNPKCRCAIDGFPIHLIMNGVSYGIYTFNIDRYAYNNMGYVSDDPNAKCLAYEAGVNSDETSVAFKNNDMNVIASEWDYRYNSNGTEDEMTEIVIGQDGVAHRVLKAGSHNELQNLITWVKEASVADFRSEVEEHFSLQHLIDYFLIVYVLGLVDNLGKNMVLVTWGTNNAGNLIWYPAFYDCDSMLGLTNDGQLKYDASVDFTFGNYNTSTSALWTKLQAAFGTQISARYQELRNRKIFSTENMMKYYEDSIISTIGQRFYNEDARLKYIAKTRTDSLDIQKLTYSYLCNGSRLEYTKKWFDERWIYMDSVYGIGDFMRTMIIRSNITGSVSLKLKSYSPQWIKISFSDDNMNQYKKFVTKDTWATFTGTINNGVDNNIYITGAPNIMYIDGLEDLYVSSLLLSNATRLVEISIPNSDNIEQLDIGSNTYLQKLDCKNCTNLGKDDNYKSINLSTCKSLKYLDISGSQISNIEFNPKGGALEYIDLSNTGITTLTLNNMEYLPEIKMNNCSDLSVVKISACNSLEKISMPHTKLNTFEVTDCTKINYLDISYTGYLTALSLDGCPELTTLNVAGVTNPNITELDLSSCTKISTINMSKCTYLKGIRFAAGCTSLNSFNASNSVIQYFRYGRNEAPDYLDLGGHNLSYVSFDNCPNIKAIKNIKLSGSNIKPFNNCVNLVSIQGSVKISGNAESAFRQCKKLTTFPEDLDLSGVTNAGDMFFGCTSLTIEHVKMIMSKMTSLQTAYHMFSGCTGIKITDSATQFTADFFKNNTKITQLYEVFPNCPNMIVELPKGIFDPLVNLTMISNPFTKVTGVVPANLFAKNTKLSTLVGLFQNSTITRIDSLETLFTPLVNLTTSRNLFRDSKQLGIIQLPDGLFAKNTKLDSVEGMFNGCKGLYGTIPTDLFKGLTKLKSVRNFFNRCGISGEIPADLFSTNTSLQDAAGFIQNCTNITGAIPETLFKNNNRLTNLEYLFNGCTNLGDENVVNGVPDTLFRGKRQLNNINAMFKGCKNLNFTLSNNLFRDCTSLAKISELFRDCLGLTGSIPENLFTCYDTDGNEVDTAVTEAKAVFYGTNISGTIPENLFKRFTKVSSLESFFQRCYQLEGEIPPELFWPCTELVSVANMFSWCSKIGKKDYQLEDNSYCLDENTFFYNPNLKNTTSMFNFLSCPYGNVFKGSVPENLFLRNAKLENTSGMFSASNVNGELPDKLFSRNPNITTVSSMFRGCSNLTKINSTLFTSYNSSIKSFSYTFDGCTKLTGTAPSIWITNPSATGTYCFTGCTKLSNYSDIPSTWK